MADCAMLYFGISFCILSIGYIQLLLTITEYQRLPKLSFLISKLFAAKRIIAMNPWNLLYEIKEQSIITIIVLNIKILFHPPTQQKLFLKTPIEKDKICDLPNCIQNLILEKEKVRSLLAAINAFQDCAC